MSGQFLIGATLILPLLGAGLILLLRRHAGVRDALVLLVPLVLLAVVLQLAQHHQQETPSELILATPIPGLDLVFLTEPLGLLFASVAALLWPVAALYSIGYLRANNTFRQSRFHAFFALAIASAMGLALAGNLLTLFVFYELLTLSTYPLVVHNGDRKSLCAGRTYLGVLLLSSLGLLLPAIVWTWAAADTLTFTPGGILQGKLPDSQLTILLLLFLFGIGKAALMPIHRWLPAAMVAPTPVSALLHAVAVVKAGVFSVLKVAVYVFGTDLLGELDVSHWAFGIAAFTTLSASVIALRQDNLKRRLAYSTIGQLAYVALGVFILAPLSLTAAAFHVAAHAFGKITLFFAAGAIYTASHKTEISQLGGIGRRMPWTLAAFSVGAASMIGIPPAAGFLTKWYLLLGAWQSEHLAAILVITISTLLNTAYFVPIIYTAWFGKAIGQPPPGEAPPMVVIPLVLTAGLSVLLFFVPGPLIQLIDLIPGTQT